MEADKENVPQAVCGLGCPHCMTPTGLLIGGEQREKMNRALQLGVEIEVICGSCQKPFNLDKGLATVPRAPGEADDLDELNIRMRTRKALRAAGITTIKQVSEKTATQLLGLKDFGVKAYRETEKALKARGLSIIDDLPR